jgi:hypothetical protein
MEQADKMAKRRIQILAAMCSGMVAIGAFGAWLGGDFDLS